MQALLDYIEASGAGLDAFARRVAISPDALQHIIAGAPIDRRLAQRIVDATGGAVVINDLSPDDGCVIDLRVRAARADDEIDQEALTRVLAEVLPALVGGAKRKGDEHLPRLAADAVAGAYAALSTVTTRRNADRLVQALLPVFAEILEEMSVPPSRRCEAAPLAQEAAERYLQTQALRR
jgi:hypothetical protein